MKPEFFTYFWVEAAAGEVEDGQYSLTSLIITMLIPCLPLLIPSAPIFFHVETLSQWRISLLEWRHDGDAERHPPQRTKLEWVNSILISYTCYYNFIINCSSPKTVSGGRQPPAVLPASRAQAQELRGVQSRDVPAADHQVHLHRYRERWVVLSTIFLWYWGQQHPSIHFTSLPLASWK